ncbi:adenylate/guanylate cyclase domain-containing protein [Mesorhizobium sp.]|uniref:adenylate/guanylate cyclase domain-containing protein n=1 Tax=Mesorhizobium sp. TaxID=1871066 RepID=UPI001224B2E2|nr:adenylate/guanylate cyclase domain-containing protein [Mesorhizobium sp.]TIL44603.1 MAG: adenylate/guanylate cyclase domain-containing protein [Mesorhizobium sp.]
MTGNRKLAAILAADVVGYSRLASADEDRTLARLRALRSDLIDPTIAVHNGRVIKRTGDGALVEFRSVVDAVRCAIEVQNAMVERNAGVPPGRRIEFRIGIHLGDVVEESDGDLMGDGVNIASRLEGIAAPGAICLSEDAYRQVKARLDLSVSDLGSTQLKNIADPIRVYSLQVGAAAPAKATTTSEFVTSRPVTALPPKLSIAVLPFANMSGDAEQEYFADGISEDTITALSKLSQLFVIARNSSFTFKGKNVNVQEVGRNLGVRYVLEGSVRKSGNRVRITAQLIDATTGGHLWAERFDRDLTDIFAVQDDVTQHIVGALALNLTEVDQQRLVTEQTDNLEAYDCFLRGREQLWRYTREQNNQARELLQRAIELDPKFASAHAFLALAHGLDYINRWSTSLSMSVEQAEEFATRAVALDDRNPYAHWALGIINLHLRRHDMAIREAERTISLAPNLAEGHESLGNTLHYSGRSEEALACFDRAMALNPYYPDMFLHFQAQAMFQLGRYEDAAASLKRRLVRNPGTDVSRVLLAASYGHLGRFDEARVQWQEVFRINPDYSLEYRRKVLPYKNPSDFELVMDGLRKAGLV